jgi:proteasome lid subunit RPN8/RPN11
MNVDVMTTKTGDSWKGIYVSMPRDFIDDIASIRAESKPNEACVLLFGVSRKSIDDHVFEIVTMRQVENVLASPVAFEMDPTSQYQVMQQEAKKERDLVGILHTHPGNQFVSAMDVKYMKNASRISRLCWLIAGDGFEGKLEIGAYIVDNGTIREIPIMYT